jgi:hypothetical protein
MGRINGYLLVVASTMSLVACGGGGGGGSGVAPITATAVIDSLTAPAIAGAVVGAASGTQSIGDLGGLAAPAGPGALPVMEANVGAPPTAEVTIGPETTTCAGPGGGEQTFTAEIANPETMSGGDSISLLFSLCDQGDGTVLDGGFDFVVQSFQGDPLTGAFLFNVGVTVSSLSMTEGGETETLSGDMNLTVDTLNPPAAATSVYGSSLTVLSGVETGSLSEFSIVTTVDPLAGTSLFEVNGYLMSSEFTGEVHFTTMAALQLDGTGEPTTGQVVITGADGATITMRVVSAQQVELDIDLDGDGSIDEMQVTTWAELQGSV